MSAALTCQEYIHELRHLALGVLHAGAPLEDGCNAQLLCALRSMLLGMYMNSKSLHACWVSFKQWEAPTATQS